MTARHQVSQAALELIKHFEGYRPRAARLADGRWTIGYGHTLTAREGAEVSYDDAEALLIYDVRPVAAAINDLTYTPLTQNQFDALVAFAFNIGLDNFRQSAVLRRINEGNLIQAAFAMELWRKAEFEGEPIVVDALVRRRAAEKTLFLTPADGWIPAPSSILRPRMDLDAGLGPDLATVLEAPLTGDVAEAHRAPGPPIEDSSASLAAAAAIRARLHEILPDPAPVIEPPPAATPAAPEPEVAPIPEPPTPEPLAADEIEPTPEPIVDPDPAPAAPTPAAVFGALYAPEPEAASVPMDELAEPVVAPPAVAPEPAPIASMDLSRRVVWREAPTEPEASRRPPLGARFNDGSTAWLLTLFLSGLIVFAAGLIWGVKGTDANPASWILGLIGIACVVSAVYIYLDRLGRRED